MTHDDEEYVQRAAAYWTVDPVSGRPLPPEDDFIIVEDSDSEEPNDADTEVSDGELAVPLTVTILVYFGKFSVHSKSHFDILLSSELGHKNIVSCHSTCIAYCSTSYAHRMP